jgi:hypothetical protein
MVAEAGSGGQASLAPGGGVGRGAGHRRLVDGAPRRGQLPGAPEGTGNFKIEADVKLLMYVTSLAANLTGQGWQLYDQRCRPPS